MSKLVKKQLQQALQNDPHGDTTALQMNPQEAALVANILKQLGGAGVQNPKTGLLQFYDAGEGSSGGPSGNGFNGGSHSDHSNTDHNSADHGYGGGNQGSGNPASGSPGTPMEKPNAIYANYKQMYDQYSAPKTPLDRLTSWLGFGAMNPTAAQAAADYAKNPTNYPDVHTRWDPVRTALMAAGMVNPIASGVSSAYGIYSSLGGPTPGIDLGPLGSGLGGYDASHPSPPSTSSPSGAPNGTGNNQGNGWAGQPSKPTSGAQAAAPAGTTGPTQSAVAQLMQQYMPAQQLNQQIPGLMDYNQWAPGYSYPWYAK